MTDENRRLYAVLTRAQRTALRFLRGDMKSGPTPRSWRGAEYGRRCFLPVTMGALEQHGLALRDDLAFPATSDVSRWIVTDKGREVYDSVKAATTRRKGRS